jgi:hypothetical protein
MSGPRAFDTVAMAVGQLSREQFEALGMARNAMLGRNLDAGDLMEFVQATNVRAALAELDDIDEVDQEPVVTTSRMILCVDLKDALNASCR